MVLVRPIKRQKSVMPRVIASFFKGIGDNMKVLSAIIIIAQSDMKYLMKLIWKNYYLSQVMEI